ncbi:uncharacterized protein LOC131159726 [Malania oleifera]|uniref:uncharacterized protein LOC131159726 n=1 Tax=Malania oleifera TaxID=397392 RepID=UPI0025AE2F32|nr:uncharacterized protein LOC131159726 [Malania oleifera]
MSEDTSADGSGKASSVLGDITNRLGKRDFSLFSDSTVRKSENKHGRIVDNDEGDSQSRKQGSLKLDRLVREKNMTNCVVGGKEKGKQPRDCVVTLQENSKPVVAQVSNEIREAPIMLDGGIHSEGDDTVSHSVMEMGDASRDSCFSSSSMRGGSGPSHIDCCVAVEKCQGNERRTASDVADSNPVCETLLTRVCSDHAKDLSVDNLASRKCGSVKGSRLAKSQGSKSFELERCRGLKNDSCLNLSTDFDSLKACSCSFCMKAAFVWSDLHYQDIKGRLTAIKKSQKEASILVHKNNRHKLPARNGHENSSKPSKLESDLMDQWRLLFLRTEDIFLHEISQLESSFHALKDLRDNCKTDLEMTNGTSSVSQKCSSDASGD